jgi:hypothetical protein
MTTTDDKNAEDETQAASLSYGRVTAWVENPTGRRVEMEYDPGSYLCVKRDQTLTPRDELDIVPVDENLSPEDFFLYRLSNADVIRSDDTGGSQMKSEAH